MHKTPNFAGHIRLTSHPDPLKPARFPIRWGAPSARERGPIIGTVSRPADRNVVGAHGGSYSLYRALAVTSGALSPIHTPDLRDTAPVIGIGPHPQWSDPDLIVSLDPWGHLASEAFAEELAQGVDIRPTIAVTKARLTFPEIVTRPDLDVFLPPVGGITLYIFGDPAALADPARKLTCRVHDECNGSDVFGSDICTCRPYLIHGIEECIKEAQNGGAGLIVYNRKEGRALGEVTQFLVYNARKRQEGGDP